jgi:glycerophosphoryl diester phosphodiesterase
MSAGTLGWLTERPIAHRGFHDRAAGRPENSLAAFLAAVENSYAIECDLHPAADGVPVVFHDADLRRLAGEPAAVRDLTSMELGRMRLLGTDEHIPTLDEMLTLVGGRVPLIIELKHVEARDAGFAAAVVERLKDYHGPAALMSFDAALLADVNASGAAMPRGWIGEGSDATNLDHLNAIAKLGVDFVSYNIDDLPTAAMTFARAVLNLPLICWTVRTPEQREKARLLTDQITFEGFTA